LSSIKFLLILILITSCAKLGYLAEQGTGQVSLLTRAKDNDDVLKDVRVSKKDKEKIKLVKEYKAHFYKYWNKKETSIYSKTTILHDEAVTYLVIVSAHNEIKAKKECFPVMGCFPYLGFFKKESAKDYARDMEKKGLVTYIRPVYAYSTLGYFTDTILSSFFYYDDYELAELIFHELFHTIFFVKDEVELNENLANYFGKEMALAYFHEDKDLRERLEKDQKLLKDLSKHVVSFARRIDKELKKDVKISKEDSLKLIEDALDESLRPEIKKVCEEHKVSDKKCYFLKRKWNQASLAAFMTYENKVDKIKMLRKSIPGDLRDFFNYIEGELKKYEDSDKKGTFSEWLFKNI
jgi:predicted aminopeptidase